jgi:hypothetical protein
MGVTSADDRWEEYICVSRMYRFLLIIAVLFCSATWTASAEAASKVSVATDRLIWKVARQEGIDPYLLRSVVAVESAFNHRAVSSKGAVGLMQLMPRTARELGVTNRYNPEQNLRGGARYLKKMIRRFSDLRLALAAYNAGPANVDRYKGIPPFTETQKYVVSVLRNYAKINPGANRSPKRIYRYKKPNGTLVLTNRQQVFNYDTFGGSNQQYRLLKRTPLLSIKRNFSNKLKTARMAPNIPAKPRLKQAVAVRQPTAKISSIILASAKPMENGPVESLISLIKEIDEIPIIRLSRQ